MAAAARARVRVGIDTGGTFTDAVRWGPDGVRRAKVPSTPDDPARAVAAALAAVGGPGRGDSLRHGTTVGTNAVLTRGGARVVLAVTAGFEDLLELGRGDREVLDTLVASRPRPLAARADVVGVPERTAADGSTPRPLTEAAVRRTVRAVRVRRPAAVAVGLLHAAAWPAHERRLVTALREALAGEGVPVHASHEASADGRELERTATAVLDAYVAPVLLGYLGRLDAALPRGTLTVMRSDGGRMGVEEVRASPARTLLSGPAGGVAAAHALVLALGVERALTFDVGGTSTDVAWLEGDDLPVGDSLRVGSHVASVPSLDLETVGAGGGSLVTLDAGGALRVGPESAGADPGPAAYGHGGPATLTDAWLLLGRLPPALLGGDFPLRPEAARAALGAVARVAGTAPRRLAAGAVAVAAATTARALRRTSVARGRDPRGAALVAFGGAGGLLAVETAERLGLARVLVPTDPGLFAARGALVAPVRADASRAVVAAGAAALRRLAARLREDVRRRLGREGARAARLQTEVEARYRGQAFTVAVPFGPGWPSAFHAAHAARYGFRDEARAVEPVRLRVRGEGREVVPGPARRAVRRARLVRRGRGPIARAALEPGDRVRGPAVLTEPTGTTWVPAGWEADVLGDGTLRLERRS